MMTLRMEKGNKLFFLTALIVAVNFGSLNGQMYSALDAHVSFISEAPLEIIKAESNELQGLVDISQKRFAYKIFVRSFKGFNSSLQQTHFYENYLETEVYPISTFTGKIIEDIENGRTEYRAKGELEIHGIKNEVIIPIQMEIVNDKLSFSSNFSIKLEDYEIEIPKIVYQKIAEVIEVNVSGSLNLRK